jgi:hypothetical protein
MYQLFCQDLHENLNKFGEVEPTGEVVVTSFKTLTPSFELE